MENPAFIHFIVGPLFLIISILFKVFPPKKINHLYGYRTRRSMKSNEAWDASNKLSASLMVGVGLVTCLVQASLYAANVSFEATIGWSTGVLVVLLLATIPVVEHYLKKNFDDQGQPLAH